MADLDRVRIFLAVAERGSFTAAARVLNLSKPKVTRELARLEQDLGVRLIQRSTRRIAVTGAGKELRRRYAAILQDVVEADTAVAQERGAVTGALRFSAPVAFGDRIVARWLGAFQRQHPEVTAELLLHDGPVDVIGAGLDLAIVDFALRDSNLLRRVIGETHPILVAAPALLQACPPVAGPRDFGKLPHVVQGSGDFLLRPAAGRTVRVRANPRARVRSHVASLTLALEGVGAAELPRFLVRDHLTAGRLVQVLPAWRPPISPIAVVRPAHSLVPPRVMLFIEHLAAAARREAPL